MRLRRIRSSGSSLQLDRDRVHHALDREIELRPAKAAHRAGRAFVGHHNVVEDVDVLDAVGIGRQAMHAIDRRRHRRAQIGAVVVPVRQPQANDDAVVVIGGFAPA